MKGDKKTVLRHRTRTVSSEQHAQTHHGNGTSLPVSDKREGMFNLLEGWAPPIKYAAFAFLIMRFAGTLGFGIITDCDETYNYWEPTHYIMYRRGFQTWEYDPKFGLRSYLYTLFHAVIGIIVGGAFGEDKITVFHRMRIVLSLITALGETVFYAGVLRAFGPKIAKITFFTMVLSGGMMHAAPSYLPSSFTMAFLLFSWGFWLLRKPTLAIVMAVIALTMGWPFAVLLLVPMAVHIFLVDGGVIELFKRQKSILYCLQRLRHLFFTGIIALFVTLGLSLVVDRKYYGKNILAVWNIIKYNALGHGGGGQGSNLYGTEPWFFYILNLFLNFNVGFLFAVMSPVCIFAQYHFPNIFGNAISMQSAIASSSSPKVKSKAEGRDNTRENAKNAPAEGEHRISFWLLFACVSQLWLWVVCMSSRPHKEERFMFPIYPLISLAAGISFSTIFAVLTSFFLKLFRRQYREPRTPKNTVYIFLVTLYVALYALLSASRIYSLLDGYSAPFKTWAIMGQALQSTSESPGLLSIMPSLSALAHPVKSWLRRSFHTESVSVETADVPLISYPGARVCVGKEWYRFPTSFFLPERTKLNAAIYSLGYEKTPGGPVELAFIESHFKGQLPQPFLTSDHGTTVSRSTFNDLNLEEKDRYVPIETCDYIIDFELPGTSYTSPNEYEHYYKNLITSSSDPLSYIESECVCEEGSGQDGASATGTRTVFKSIWRTPFLHSDSTPAIARSYYFPSTSHLRVYGVYHILAKQEIGCTC